MSEIIDVVAVVDLEGLLSKYPNGLAKNNNSHILDPYFDMLVPSGNAYHDPKFPDSTGIRCHVSDVIRFRSIPKSDVSHGVTIQEFADKSEGESALELRSYISSPNFLTASRKGLMYDPRQAFPKPSQHDGWDIWKMPTVDADIKDPFVRLTALKSTADLTTGSIRYTLGLASMVPQPGAGKEKKIEWFWDPAIQIEG